MRVAALQMDIAFERRTANFEKVARYAQAAADDGVDLLVLPEMFATGFSMNPDLTAEPRDGETERFLKSLARQHRLAVIGGFVQIAEGRKPRNVALSVGRDGTAIALYAKTHLFSFMGEDRHHEAGDTPCPFEIDGLRAACAICYDLRFPELFRMLAPTCDAVFVIASWPASRRAHWDVLLRARAVENQLYVVGVNRVGSGDGLLYDGGSAVIGPDGNVIAQREDEEGLLVADIDPKQVVSVRAAMPVLADRRF